MQSQNVLCHVCHFLAEDARAWTTKDLQDLATLQTTSTEAHKICSRPMKALRPIAVAHSAVISEFEAYVLDKIHEERLYWYEEGEPEWKHPFTGEWIEFNLRVCSIWDNSDSE